MRSTIAAFTALVGCVAAVGCGGDGSDDYADDYAGLSNEIQALGAKVAKTIDGAADQTDEQLADAFANYGKQLGDLQQDVDALDTPEDLEAEQEDLVSAMGEVQGALNDVSKAAEEHDAPAARKATVQLVKDTAPLGKARRQLLRSSSETE